MAWHEVLHELGGEDLTEETVNEPAVYSRLEA